MGKATVSIIEVQNIEYYKQLSINKRIREVQPSLGSPKMSYDTSV